MCCSSSGVPVDAPRSSATSRSAAAAPCGVGVAATRRVWCVLSEQRLDRQSSRTLPHARAHTHRTHTPHTHTAHTHRTHTTLSTRHGGAPVRAAGGCRCLASGARCAIPPPAPPTPTATARRTATPHISAHPAAPFRRLCGGYQRRAQARPKQPQQPLARCPAQPQLVAIPDPAASLRRVRFARSGWVDSRPGSASGAARTPYVVHAVGGSLGVRRLRPDARHRSVSDARPHAVFDLRKQGLGVPYATPRRLRCTVRVWTS